MPLLGELELAAGTLLGGLGGPLPIPECRPYKMSWRFKMINKIGALAVPPGNPSADDVLEHLEMHSKGLLKLWTRTWLRAWPRPQPRPSQAL